jgi:hypothetical protein
VDAVDVWAYPVGTSTAIYVGAATYGIARGDGSPTAASRWSDRSRRPAPTTSPSSQKARSRARSTT